MDENSRPGEADEHARLLRAVETLQEHVGRLVAAGGQTLGGEVEREVTHHVVPAWRRLTRGEPRWQAGLAVVAAVALQLPLPGELTLAGPRWLLPGLEILLFLVLVVANPRRIDRESQVIRAVSLTLTGIISLGNAWSAGRLVVRIVSGRGASEATALLVTGGAIWLTNVIVFALWYWEFDRGGPVARMHGTRAYPDFQFTQMSSPELAPRDWEPRFGDYLYLSFTNATAFSPTDVLPLSRWAKMTMMGQSAVSLTTIALVIARAVNVLR